MPSVAEQIVLVVVFSLVPVSVVVALVWLIARTEYRTRAGGSEGGAGRGDGGGNGGETSRLPLGPLPPAGGPMRAADDDLARSA